MTIVTHGSCCGLHREREIHAPPFLTLVTVISSSPSLPTGVGRFDSSALTPPGSALHDRPCEPQRRRVVAGARKVLVGPSASCSNLFRCHSQPSPGLFDCLSLPAFRCLSFTAPCLSVPSLGLPLPFSLPFLCLSLFCFTGFPRPFTALPTLAFHCPFHCLFIGLPLQSLDQSQSSPPATPQQVGRPRLRQRPARPSDLREDAGEIELGRGGGAGGAG